MPVAGRYGRTSRATGHPSHRADGRAELHHQTASPSNFGIRSLSFPGLSVVYIQLDDNVKDKQKEFSDINLKLNQLNAKLPRGAGPIQFNSNFGDTAALMLTVASPMSRPPKSRCAPSPSARPLRDAN